MAKYVLKFGGTSLKDAETIERAYNIITEFYNKNNPEQLVVVASAAGKIGNGNLEDKVTNLLENIHGKKDVSQCKQEVISRTSRVCEELGIAAPLTIYQDLDAAIKQNKGRNDKMGYALITSIGERISAHTLAEFFRKRGTELKSFDFNEFGMVVDNYEDAYTTEEATIEIEKKLKMSKGIVILPGFIGYMKNGDIATLGRDGSNYSATSIGEAILAEEVFIFNKEQPGVRRAPPHLVPDADVIEQLSYNEGIEYAELGAKIINAKSIGPAQRENIPISIVDENFHGTKIQRKVSLEHMGVKIIASVPNLSILTVRYASDRPGVLADIAGYFKKASINIASSSDEMHAMSFAFAKDNQGSLEMLLKLGEKYSYVLENDFARVSVIGEGMKNQIGVLEKLTSVYQKKGISIESISQTPSQLNITTFIKQEHERIAVRGLYDVFFRNNRE